MNGQNGAKGAPTKAIAKGKAMYVILVYDIAGRELKERDNSRRIRKTIEKYLPRVQYSVYEGEIKESDMKKLKAELTKHAESELDSIIFYEFATLSHSKRTVIGIDKLDSIFTE